MFVLDVKDEEEWEEHSEYLPPILLEDLESVILRQGEDEQSCE